MKKIIFFFTFFFFSILISAQFGSQTDINKGAIDPAPIELRDLDDDGLLDIVYSSRGGKISWHKNLDDGLFSEQNIISNSVVEVGSMNIADINNDGKLDIISAGSDLNEIIWFENLGSGTFSDKIIIAEDIGYTTYVICSDLNNDGNLDVVFTGASSTSLHWAENLGSGSFSEPLLINEAIVTMRDMKSSDLDNDGDQDIAYISFSDKLCVFLNNSDGTFSEEILITEALYGGNNVELTDLNNDGLIDIVSASADNDEVAWYENFGSGSFGEQQLITATLQYAGKIESFDINEDGFKDLVVISGISLGGEYINVAWYQNISGGASWIEHSISNSHPSTQGLSYGDIDNDGDNDLLVSSFNASTISIFDNISPGDFGEEIVIYDSVHSITDSSTGDFDNDGDIDIAICSQKGEVRLYDNNGDGSYSELIIGPEDGTDVYAILAYDGDHDGDLDILKGSSTSNKVFWYENAGSGEFLASEQFLNLADPEYLAAGDFNGDGVQDHFIYSEYFSTVYWRSHLDGITYSPVQLDTEVENLREMTIADVDLDGKEDLLLAFDNQICLYRHLSDEDFEKIIITDDLPFATSVKCTDINGDGNLDLLGSNHSYVFRFMNDGENNFGSQFFVSSESTTAGKIVLVDFDGDGYKDIICGSTMLYNKVGWYRSQGNGLFNPVELFEETYLDASKLFVADLDNDTDLDIVTTNKLAGFLSVIENYSGAGCMDATACNYNSEAYVEDFSCCYGVCGCEDEFATNYTLTYDCLGDFCEYSVPGVVYLDENSNGIKDLGEVGLPDQEVNLPSLGFTSYTNADGEFIFNGLSSEEFDFSIILTEAYPYATSSVNINSTINEGVEQDTLFFGVNFEVTFVEIEVAVYPPQSGYLCDEFLHHDLLVTNDGNVPIDIVIALEMDTLFQGYQELSIIDSVIDNTIYYSFLDLHPGEDFLYSVNLHSPTVEHIGEWLTTTTTVTGYFEGTEVSLVENELVQEMTCAYDPNDKQVFPNGYYDPHFVLPETELNYLIRFQNTGNAPAINVVVKDTIDPNLDLSSFEVLASSHLMYTNIDIESRSIDFVFDNIMLPDSVNNEPESHGFISFNLTPFSDLEPNTEINNTAHIYFDNNPPIVTNTTWSTIYECTNLLASVSLAEGPYCINGTYPFINNQDYIENYEWSINDMVVGDSLSYSFIPVSSATYNLSLIVDNPLCEASSNFEIIVLDEEVPLLSMSEDQEICLGTELTITAESNFIVFWQGFGTGESINVIPEFSTTYLATTTNEVGCETSSEVSIDVNPLPSAEFSEDGFELTAVSGTAYQWYLDGVLIDSATQQTYTAEENGNYSVEVWNEYDCSQISDEVFITVIGVDELSEFGFSIYPNPMIESTTLNLGPSNESFMVRLYSIDGRLVQDCGSVNSNQLEISRSDLSSGQYLIEIVNQEQSAYYHLRLMIK